MQGFLGKTPQNPCTQQIVPLYKGRNAPYFPHMPYISARLYRLFLDSFRTFVLYFLSDGVTEYALLKQVSDRESGVGRIDVIYSSTDLASNSSVLYASK